MRRVRFRAGTRRNKRTHEVKTFLSDIDTTRGERKGRVGNGQIWWTKSYGPIAAHRVRYCLSKEL